MSLWLNNLEKFAKNNINEIGKMLKENTDTTKIENHLGDLLLGILSLAGHLKEDIKCEEMEIKEKLNIMKDIVDNLEDKNFQDSKNRLKECIKHIENNVNELTRI